MSCTGCNDGCFDESVQLATGLTGANGVAGTNGINGLYGGWSLKWKFDTNTGSGTGTNEVRLNNASPASATEIYVNDDAFGTGAADVFLSSVTSAPYGRIKIFKEYDSTIFWLATITAADAAAVPAEVKFTVTDVVTNGTFTDADDIVLTLAPTGPAGTNGTDGVDGKILLQTITSSININTPGYSTAITGPWIVPYNTLDTDGDTLRLQAQSMITQTDNSFGGMQVRIGTAGAGIQYAKIGTALVFAYDHPNYAVASRSSLVLNLDIVRVSSTSIRIESKLTDFLIENGESSYTGSIVSTKTKLREMMNMHQIINVDDLTTAAGDLSIDVLLKTDSNTRPIKLLYGKLYSLNK